MNLVERIHAESVAGAVELEAVLRGPAAAPALVAFLRSRPDGRLTALEEYIAAGLEVRGFATVQINLLSRGEQAADDRSACLHLDPVFLQSRASAVLNWVSAHPALRHSPLGLFADGVAAAAALLGAAAHPDQVRAIVCLDGRVELASTVFAAVQPDTLLLVAEGNTHLTDLNRQAQIHIRGAGLEVVPQTSHRYEDARAISHVAWRTIEWFSHALFREPELVQ